PYTLIAADVPWTLSDDVLLDNQNVRIRSGVEHWFFDGKLGLRAGFISFVTLPGEFSIGASYKATDWSLDYAFMNHSDNLGDSHRIEANYYFNAGSGKPEPRPYMVQSLVGDQKIYLKWDIPAGSQADGYLVYVKSDTDMDFHRAKQELLLTKYCLLRGAKNGLRYHIFIRSVVDGQEKYSCNEWVAIAQPMSEDAKKYYDQGLEALNQNKVSTALYAARKAEEFDPNNYDIKNLIQKLETTNHDGLVPEEGQN
ncbi:MAG TPA: fibronectin type III domain-containing protein, partial [bacterium]|nr:fibronectin type III domain-containing protein [bacterium]